MKIKNLFFLLALVPLISCEQVMDNYWDRKAEENYISPYKGTYLGSFAGNDSGSLKIEVSKSDNVTITKHSSISNSDEMYYDGLIGASFNGSPSPATGFKLLGNLNSSNNTYSGNWTQGNASGTWTLTKQ
ncbi:hypothetical protein [Chryseobacterium sp.]|uniref:hypothetical protein n=1 Tax=Chryseobacterium sp. TaxID=1871047 RepID=UPI0011CA7B74|nr:hypothetical protein [Chryseobacterium sp.]TXF77200.1 hypothetical protein FUA25_04480 [Chryseobacterium sp.]